MTENFRGVASHTRLMTCDSSLNPMLGVSRAPTCASRAMQLVVLPSTTSHATSRPSCMGRHVILSKVPTPPRHHAEARKRWKLPDNNMHVLQVGGERSAKPAGERGKHEDRRPPAPQAVAPGGGRCLAPAWRSGIGPGVQGAADLARRLQYRLAARHLPEEETGKSVAEGIADSSARIRGSAKRRAPCGGNGGGSMEIFDHGAEMTQPRAKARRRHLSQACSGSPYGDALIRDRRDSDPLPPGGSCHTQPRDAGLGGRTVSPSVTDSVAASAPGAQMVGRR